MPYEAASSAALPLSEDALNEDAWLLLQMRRATYHAFANALSAAAPDPMPEWAQSLLARWSLEALR